MTVRSASTAVLDKTRARAASMAWSGSVTFWRTGSVVSAPAAKSMRDCMSAMRSVLNGWLRRYGKLPASLSREAWASLPNMDTNPWGA